MPAVALLRPARPGIVRLAAGAVLLGLAVPLCAAAGAAPAPAAPTTAAPAPAGLERITLSAPAAPALSASGSAAPRTVAPRTAVRPSRRAQVAIRQYWTPARMAAARPGEMLAPGAGTQFVRSGWLDNYLHRLGSGQAAATEPADPGAPWTQGGAIARTTGKVFFSLGGDDYVCSGSAVSTPDRSTVLTAGHCVYEPETGTAATNWAFVPGYANGKAPYGVFPARHLASPAGWRTVEDFDVDVAFADVGPNGAGTALTDAVGGQAIGFNMSRGGMLHAFGYPAAPPWTGERLVHCANIVEQDRGPEPSQDQGMKCAMTPGSSGGPWLANFSSRTGRGTLVSVTSFSYSDRPGVLWGPYLGTTAQSLYDSVAATPGA